MVNRAGWPAAGSIGLSSVSSHWASPPNSMDAGTTGSTNREPLPGLLLPPAGGCHRQSWTPGNQGEPGSRREEIHKCRRIQAGSGPQSPRRDTVLRSVGSRACLLGVNSGPGRQLAALFQPLSQGSRRNYVSLEESCFLSARSILVKLCRRGSGAGLRQYWRCARLPLRLF
jgi:hypothetical protein